MRAAEVLDARHCRLGEGALWHPARGELFWFDILAGRLLSHAGTGPRAWEFGEQVSAAGWIDAETLLIASETALFRFDLATGARTDLMPLEADNPANRSNDGRADPQGGFWISTMSKRAEPGAGAIYRYAAGRLTRLFSGLTIPNAISFSPDGRLAYFTDTPTRRILRQPLDGAGWPRGAPELFADLSGAGTNPDGAVVDASGALWVALWGAGQVARFGPDGHVIAVVDLPVTQPSCPAFGGEGLTRLFVTSAREGLDAPDEADGRLFAVDTAFTGQPEHRVRP